MWGLKCEFKVTFLLILLTRFVTKCYSQEEIHIVHPERRDDTVSAISKAIQELQKSYVKNIIPQYMVIDDDKIKESVDQLCRLLYEGISIVMDFTQNEWNQGKDLIISSKVPYLKVDLSLHGFLAGLEDLIRIRNGKDIVLIFQNDYELQEGTHYLITKSSLRVLCLNGFKPDLSNQLKNLRPLPGYFGIIADVNNMKAMLKELSKTQIFKYSAKWNIVVLDRNVDAFDTNMIPANMTLIRLNENYVYKADQMLGQYSTQFKDQILFEIMQIIQGNKKIAKINRRRFSCEEYFNAKSGADATFNDNTENLIKAIQNSDVLKFEANTLTYRLNLSIETVAENGRTFSIAAWNDGALEFTLNKSLKPPKRFFRIGTTEAIPWSFLQRNTMTQETLLDDEGNFLWQGYCIDLIKELAEIMQFDYEIVAPRRGTFGKRLHNGTWTGIVGDLVRGETDIAVAALKMTAEREEVIDFIAPYYDYTGISIVIRKPFRQTSLFKFMTVLRLEVWISIIAALVATALMIWLLDKYSPYSAQNNPTAYPYVCRDFTLKESFWFALTSFTPQGGGEVPKSISARTLVAAYWLFVVLMLATFTANLAAFLTVERMQTPVQSLEQLARQSRINYTVVEASDTHKYFINMKFAEDTLYRLWKELTLNASSDQSQYRIWDYPIKEQYGHILLAINSSNPVKTADEGFKKVSDHGNSDFAFIHDSAEIKYEISQNCNLTEIGEVFAEQPYAIAVQQGSQLQDELSFAILDLQKKRFFESLTAKYWNNSKKHCDNMDESEGITLESLGGVFIATLFGLGLAMVTLVCEVVYYRRKTRIASSTKVNEPVRFNPNAIKSSFAHGSYKRKKHKNTPLTLATEFKPTRKRITKITYIQPGDTSHIPYYYE